MSGKSVVFYGVSSDFTSVALRLIEKLYENKENTLLLCNNADEVKFFDSKLWTYSKLSFIPHGSHDTIKNDRMRFCHTWISSEIEFPNDPVCLIHNGLKTEDSKISSFKKVIDIFNINLVDAARSRSLYYKSLGFDDQKFWEQVESSWKISEFSQ